MQENGTPIHGCAEAHLPPLPPRHLGSLCSTKYSYYPHLLRLSPFINLLSLVPNL